MDLVSSLISLFKDCLIKLYSVFSSYYYSLIYFTVFTDEELDALLDRSDMVETSIKTNVPQTANHFEVVDTNF